MNDKVIHPYIDIMESLEVGYWKIVNNENFFWSSAFLENLGYTIDEVDVKLDFFINKLLEEKYKNQFKKNFNNLIKNRSNFNQQIRILHKSGDYKEYTCKTNDGFSLSVKKNSNFIFFIKKRPETHEKLRHSNFYYGETAKMTRTGSWYIDFIQQKSYWDNESKRLLGYSEDYTPSLNESYKYYAPEYHNLATKLFNDCSRGIPFKTEIKMMTASNREFWVKAVGKPIYNETNEVVGIRGVFHDIDEQKQKEITLQHTSNIISSQNSRLLSFAHIVSHNLRSHTSNLELIVRLINSSETNSEKLELIDSIKDISKSLNTTIEHLNEVVTIQTQANHKKEEVNFFIVLNQVKKSISNIIKKNNVTINTDFSLVESIYYVPAYLESILLNLLTNAIKYKHDNRDPIINIKTYLVDKKVFLEFQDNGSGIDMNKFGNKIFGMYKTFHYNTDAVGMGLFLVKNHIQSLNGDITVKSKVNVGTTFKIQF